MKHTKIFIYSSIGIVFLFILSIWISTQWVAALLHYHHQLGKPLFVFYGYPIYAPKFFYWWYFYGVYAPKAFDRAAIAIYAGVFIFIRDGLKTFLRTGPPAGRITTTLKASVCWTIKALFLAKTKKVTICGTMARNTSC